MTLTGFESASALAADIKAGRLTATELLDSVNARIDRLNGSVNAVVARALTLARHRAQETDLAIERRHPPGPLAGLPITIKDSIEVAGLPTTSGTLGLMRHRPLAHAPAVARLADAGATILGKTNLPAFAGDYQTYNKVFGPCRNPWDPAHTPGGSSGGSAAAVAAGLTPLDIGSDLAGSVRLPAHYCGIYGHKPSFGVVPTAGHVPPPPNLSGRPDIAVFGPLARSADDLDLALGVMAGPDGAEARAWRLDLPAPRGTRLQDLRVAHFFEDLNLPLDRESLALLDACVDALAMAGVGKLTHGKPDFAFGSVRDTGHTLIQAMIGAGLPDGEYRTLKAAGALVPPIGRQNRFKRRAAQNITASYRDWNIANTARHQIRAACETFFQDHDVLLLPVAPTAAPLRDETTSVADRTINVNGVTYPAFAQGDWCMLASLAYLPATIAPIGRTKDGLPIGVQIVGPFLEDRTTIAMAKYLADVVGGYEAPPGFG